MKLDLQEANQVLLDSGSTSSYINDRKAHSFNLIIQWEEGSEQLTLLDGSKVQAEGYVSFSIAVWPIQQRSNRLDVP